MFLAVPALQRNYRNTARKEDVGRLAAALDSYYYDHPELTLSAGPNQILRSTGKIVGYQGTAGNLSYINNKCDFNTGQELSSDPNPAIGDAIGQRSEQCSDGTEDQQGVYMFRENNPDPYHGVLGPYKYSTSAYGPDTVHIMIGAKCSTAQGDDPTGINYAYFVEENDIHYVAIAYAFENGGPFPDAHCNDYSL